MKPPKNIGIGQYSDVVKSFHEESDRAAAVLAMAYADAYIGGFIRSFFVDDPEVEELFAETAPLGTFVARVKIAYALGLISKDMTVDARYLAKVRNRFAHEFPDYTFDSPIIKDLCSNLSTAKPIPKEGGGTYIHVKPRDQFLFAVSSFVGQLHNIRLARSEANQPNQGA